MEREERIISLLLNFYEKKDKNGTHYSQETDHKLKTTKYCIKKLKK